MRCGVPCVIDQQDLPGLVTKPSGGPGSGVLGFTCPSLPAGFTSGGIGFGKWRLVAEAARHIDGAENDLQEMNGAAGLKAVGMGRDAAHGMHGDRAANRLVMAAAEIIRPRNIELDLLLEGHLRQFGGDARDGLGRNAAFLGHRIGCIFFAARKRSAISVKLVTTLRPSGSVKRPMSFGVGIAESAGHRVSPAVGIPHQCRCRTHCERTGHHRRRPDSRSPAMAHWCSGSRYSPSIFWAASSSWISAPTNKPSVPGLMPIHSSAMAE